MDGIIKLISAMGAGRVIALLTMVGALGFFFFFVFTRISEPPYGMLYGDLELSDSADIVERLQAMNIPYSITNNGKMIMVPQDQISTLRVTLAGEGLGGSVTGYEIFDRGDNLGATSFVQNINRIRAVEGELSRTISEITSVVSARVHIVVPERVLFREETRDPTAAIVLKTRRGGLTSSQVTAIQYLVSAAVPGLNPQLISIVDQNGTLLARSSAGDGETSAGAEFEERRRSFESRLRNQIEALLESTVGAGKVRAEVSVDLNVNRVTLNTDAYDPDSQVIMSQSSSEDTSTDQENNAATGVSVGANLPGGQATGTPAGGPSNVAQTSRTTETTNFEYTRTQSTEIREGGEVMRMSVAVLVDGIYTTDANGNEVYSPRSQAELDQLTTLVQTQTGYDPNRGDTVEVINLQFAAAEEVEDIADEFTVAGLDTEAITNLAERIFWFISAILAFFMIVRPLVQKIMASIPAPPPPAPVRMSAPQQMPAIPSPEEFGITPELAAAAASGDDNAIKMLAQARQQNIQPSRPLGVDSQIDVATVEGRVQDSALKKVGDIVLRHPEESTAIVRSWLYAD